MQLGIPGTGGANANGTTVLPVGSFQNIKLVVTDTSFQLFLNGLSTPEITLASSNATKNIGGFAMGKFYGSTPLTMYYDNATFGVTATYYAPPNGGLLPAAASTGTVSTPPTVTLSSNQTTGAAPVSLTLTSAVTAGSAATQSVKFYQGGSLIGTVTQSPYTLAVANLAQGTYSFTSVVTDTSSNTGNSNAVTVTVTATTGGGAVTSVPSVSLALSSNSAVAPASVTLTATPSTTSGYVTLVEFFSSGSKVGQSTVSPWTLTESSLPASNYQFSAKVTDNSGNTATSQVQTFVVSQAASSSATPPTITVSVTVTSPTPPAAVTLSAAATGQGGTTIQSVSFYQNGTLLVNQTVSPYTYGVAGLAAGTYSFTAVATDSNAAQTTTPVQTLIITPVTVITVAGSSGAVSSSNIQEVTPNTQGTLLDIKQYVGHQWGRNDGNVPDPSRDSLINDARHAYYASRRWSFLFRNGFVFQLSVDTVYPTLHSAPLPSNRNRMFDLGAAYDSNGRPITKHTVDQLLLQTTFPLIQGIYAIDERRGVLLTSLNLPSIYGDYWLLPPPAKLDGSEDLFIEYAPNLTAIKYLSMSLNWEAGERDDANFNVWQGLYEKEYQADVRIDAQNQAIRQFRQTPRNNGYSRRGGQAPPSGYVSRYS